MNFLAARNRKVSSVLILLTLGLVAGGAQAALYEAEDFKRTRGCSVKQNHDGYSGNGFVDMGGLNSFFETGSINGNSGGMHTLTFRYASRDNQNRKCQVIVNGTFAGEVNFAPSGAWTNWVTDTIDIQLERGPNSIQIKASTEKGGPNVDSIEVTKKFVSHQWMLNVQGGNGSGRYASGREIAIVAQAAPAGKVFDRWLTNSGSVWIEDGSAYRTRLIMPDGDATVTAKYKNATEPVHEAHGDLHFAIVLLDYAGDGSAQPVDEVREGYFDGENSVANFISQASYGKTTMTGDIFGWITPPDALYGGGDQWSNCWPLDQDRFNLLLENYPDADLNAYDGFVFYVHRHPDSDCNAFGISTTIGLEDVETNTAFGNIRTRINYVSTDFYFPYQAYSRITDSTAAHEIIHSLGIMGHSLSYICGNQTLSANPSDCYVQAYGDIFAIMGLRSQASHPNAVMGERLGWLDENTLTTVENEGEYTLYSLEEQSPNVKAIKIPLDNPIDIGNYRSIDTLFVEYRGMTGFDERGPWFRNIATNDGTQVTIDNIHGALIHGADCTTNNYCVPYLLDMHPGSIDASYAPNKMARAYLYAGESFEVPFNNMTIEVIQVDPEYSLTVKVNKEEDIQPLECPSSVVIRAIPDPSAPSHINWRAASTIVNYNRQSSGFGCEACIYSSSNLNYTISSAQGFDCPAEISVTAGSTTGASFDEWEINSSEPLPLNWSNTYNGVKYCSYRKYNFNHELAQCR